MRIFIGPLLALVILWGCSPHSDSYRPGKTGKIWTYTDSTVTNGHPIVRERFEELGQDTLLLQNGQKIQCRTLIIQRKEEKLSRIWFSDTGNALLIHRLDHLAADETILYNPPYPMLAPTKPAEQQLNIRLSLYHRNDKEPYHSIDAELRVYNEWVEELVDGRRQQVLIQELKESGRGGLTYRKTWLKGYGKIREEVRGGIEGGPSIYSLMELVP